jgi:hypothetical protein
MRTPAAGNSAANGRGGLDMDLGWRGATAAVTGGSSGMGRAAALCMA